MSDAVLLVSHGSVEDLDDLTAFVTNVRRGHAPPPELVQELRRRYEVIGGKSPLNSICAEVAQKLERRLGVAVAWANRLFVPYVREVVLDLARNGVTRIALVPLAPHSAHVYAEDARHAVEGTGIALVCASNWGRDAGLCNAFASRIATTLASFRENEISRTTVIMTAHSLPRSVVDAGDAYEREVHAGAIAVGDALRTRFGLEMRCLVAFQSQGMTLSGPDGRAGEWLGPDLRTTLDVVVSHGDRHAAFAPIGFLADHVEILYDLDVEARHLAGKWGLSYARVPSLNADDDFIDVLASLARPLLAHG